MLQVLRLEIRRFTGSQKGATAVEYGLIIGLMALGLAAGLGTLTDLVNDIFDLLVTSTQEAGDSIGT